MANVVNKIFTDRLGGRNAAEYIGVKGDLFYDSDAGDLRLSDGITAGGIPLGNDNSGPYRHFQAGVNLSYNTGDSQIVQLIIHDLPTKPEYMNFTENPWSDDFYATGLIDNYNEASANKIIVLNLYGTYNNPLNIQQIRTFARKFIDTVLYDANDNQINDINAAKAAFYANIEDLKAIVSGFLYPNFSFTDERRQYWPEYNQTTVDGNGADFKINLTWAGYVNDTEWPYGDISDIRFMNGGHDYAIGDKLTVNGGQLGGVNGTNDLTLVVTGLKNGAITGLNMTSGGDSFNPHSNFNNWNWMSGGSGDNAAIHIKSCKANGEIVDWELRNTGYGYQVGDTLTINYGGSDATFEVTSVGNNSINDFYVEGNAYIGSPNKIENGYWPLMSIADGGDDQYDWGNWISTQSSATSVTADVNGHKLTITNFDHQGTLPLQVGMSGVWRDPENGNWNNFTLISQATDDNNVWYIDNTWYPISGAVVRFDGIPYNNGNVVSDSAFNGDGTSDRVTVYQDSIFAMIAFNTWTNSVYYNGFTGSSWRGYKQASTLLGTQETFDNRSIPQKNQWWNYTLEPTDAGKHIYKPNPGNSTVFVPTAGQANFPIGSVITIVSGDGGWVYIQANDETSTQIWGAGFNDFNAAWYIPNNSIATLLKIGADKWMLSGAGLASDL